MPLDIEEIHRRLGESYEIIYHPETGSTNDAALALARDGAPGWTLVCAEYQTAGRGRRGAQWIAPVESSVLCSLLVRLRTPVPTAFLTMLTGVAVAGALRHHPVPAEIKWPNDIMVNNRKVAGILVEATGDAVVIGTGINCTTCEEDFPSGLRERAGSLLTTTGHAFRREDVLVAVQEGLATAFNQAERGEMSAILESWNANNWLANRRVRVHGSCGPVVGDGLRIEGDDEPAFRVFLGRDSVLQPLDSRVEVL